MVSSPSKYPLMGIDTPFSYKLKSHDHYPANETRSFVNLIQEDLVSNKPKKRKTGTESEEAVGAKKIKISSTTAHEEKVQIQTLEPSIRFKDEDPTDTSENRRCKTPPDKLITSVEDTTADIGNTNSATEKNNDDTNNNNSSSSSSSSSSNNNSNNNNNEESTNGSPMTIGNTGTLVNQTDDALPLSPLASPGYTPTSELSLQPPVNLLQDYISSISNTTHAQLPASAYRNLIFHLISKLGRSELSDLGTLIKDNLKRDFFSSLPLEISLKILTNLCFEDISRCLQVSKDWNQLINGTSFLWKRLMLCEGFVTEENFKKYCQEVPIYHQNLTNVEDRFRLDFLRNRSYLRNWVNPDFKPYRKTLRGHTTSVVTCLQFDDDYVITGADDKMIHVYDSRTEKFKTQLTGHEGGVWALKYDKDGTLVSGSTDRSVRVWNIKEGKCTHIFKGHTSTVRCLDIVEHKGKKFIVTGSRDNTLHVWRLPNCKSPDYNPRKCEIYNTTANNPFFVGVLRGHMASVRTVSGHGNIVISGSYDHNLMIWDIAEMKCLYVLTGHSDRIYSTIYDYKRHRCISASMDSTIRVWDLKNIHKNGHCSMISSSTNPCTKITGAMLTLQGHTALVGLLGLSDKFLVSAAADGSLRGWDSNDYSRKFAYHHTNLSAITTFCMNDNLLVSGSEGQFNVYNLRTGKLVHSNLLRDADQIWSVKFNNRKLVAAVEKGGSSFVEILDFGNCSDDDLGADNDSVNSTTLLGFSS